MSTRHVGLYRGSVVQNLDPAGRQRIQVRIPLEGAPDAPVWAEACLTSPAALTPQIGDTVWIMFEAGDPQRPVWIGLIGR